jgi:putative aldouronate transport system permease protein
MKLKSRSVFIKTAIDYFIEVLSSVKVIIAAIVTLYPFIYTFSCSISRPDAVIANEVILWPVGFSTYAYQQIFDSNIIWRYYYNTLWYTLVGTFLSVLVTCITAYPLTRKNFFARNFFMMFVTLPMFISGGLIPFFIVVVKTGLYNSRWSMVVPSLIAIWNLIICRTFFQSVPEELIESAIVDGCSHLRVLFSIVMPVSKAVIAVLVIFYGVGQWNTWFNALLFLNNSDLQPLQIFLRRILIMLSPDVLSKIMANSTLTLSFYQLKYAVVMVVVGPIIAIYPFLQKYFVKGVMIGSLKG